MYILAFILLSAVAAFGTGMGVALARHRSFPSFFGAAHGGFAAASVLFLLVTILRDVTPPTQAWWALGVFGAALAGGLTLFRLIFRGRAPTFYVIAHGALGSIGLVLLANVAFFQQA
ncbi:hypothetical protein [Sphingobium aquiterrae]|jgi:hypothetical protein|uniref:hypothetical protein n=1 Tax=Sphingobium aquiterrae TaxID=2038656 RepID=UPI003016F5E8|tara:strand:+ start:21121 stop:21471 length:351 start_codon:yes stop_codon:yes gene_type:complete